MTLRDLVDDGHDVGTALAWLRGYRGDPNPALGHLTYSAAWWRGAEQAGHEPSPLTVEEDGS